MSWDPVSMAVGMAIGIAFVLFVLGVSHWAAEQLATFSRACEEGRP